MSKSTHNQEFWTNKFHSSQHLRETKLSNSDWHNIHDTNPKRYNFWMNPLNSKSLRLSRSGFQWIKDCTDIKFWKVKIKTDILPRTFIKLERALSAPYYIQDLGSITVFGEEDLIMLQLHAGDLETYLNNIIENDD